MNKRAAYGLTACVTIFFTVFFLYPAVIVLKEAFYSSDDGLMNADFIDFIEKSLDINWKKTLADIVDRLEHEDRYKKFQQIYRKILVSKMRFLSCKSNLNLYVFVTPL